MARKQKDFLALRDMMREAHDILRTTKLPEKRAQRAYELLTAALFLLDELTTIPIPVYSDESPAAKLGAKGGKMTAKRGSEYFRQIAAKRKTHAGGRPPKEPKPN